jgi:hypothetical protein
MTSSSNCLAVFKGSIFFPVILKDSISAHPRRPTSSDSLEGHLEKAKSSMVASPVPKSLIYHGKKDAYFLSCDLRRWCE